MPMKTVEDEGSMRPILSREEFMIEKVKVQRNDATVPRDLVRCLSFAEVEGTVESRSHNPGFPCIRNATMRRENTWATGEKLLHVLERENRENSYREKPKHGAAARRTVR